MVSSGQLLCQLLAYKITSECRNKDPCDKNHGVLPREVTDGVLLTVYLGLVYTDRLIPSRLLLDAINATGAREPKNLPEKFSGIKEQSGRCVGGIRSSRANLLTRTPTRGPLPLVPSHGSGYPMKGKFPGYQNLFLANARPEPVLR